MRYSEFLALARKQTHEDGPGVVVGRFLLEKNGLIIRDHFLSIIENEGVGSARVRKIMYGLWMLRDPRVRNFILRRIVDENGHWRPEEVTRLSNKDFFGGESRQKIRSNLEHFLQQAGIFDEVTVSVHLERNDGWLEDSVLAAAQHEEDVQKRHEMTTDPIGFLIRQRWTGLANASVVELQATPAIVPALSDPVFESEVQQLPPQRGVAHRWNRTAPSAGDRREAVIKSNPVAVERANQAHYNIERDLKDKIERVNSVPNYTPYIDLYFVAEAGTIIFEVKSCYAATFHSQVRRGVSQLLEYRFRYHDILDLPISLVLVVETPPPSKYRWTVDYLLEIGILLVWKSNDGFNFVTSEEIPASLVGIVDRTAVLH